MESAGVDIGLQTPRLSLRRAGLADVDLVLRLHPDPLAVAHNPSDVLADRPAAQRLLQRWIDHWVRHGVGHWAISWRDDPEVRPVIARVRPVNRTSARVALKAGSPGPQSSTV